MVNAMAHRKHRPLAVGHSAPANSTSIIARTEAIVQWISETGFDDLPDSVVENTKRFILDSIGCALAGTSAPGPPSLAALARTWAPTTGEATLWGFGAKGLGQHAALVNGTSVHALEFDDVYEPGAFHATATVVPAAFAAAEQESARGDEVVTAIALGIELGCRLALASAPSLHPGMLPTTLCGVFAAAAAAGKLLHLGRNELRDSLGLAYSQASGNRQALIDGALAKRVQPGFAGMSGLLAADLARAGITGSRQPIDGLFGFAALYARGSVDESLIYQLGDKYELDRITCRPYPSCRSTHAAIDGVLTLRQTHRFDAADVAEVRITTNPLDFELVGRPFAIRDSAQVDAQFSNAYVVAVAILDGAPQLRHFDDVSVATNRAAQALASRVVSIPATTPPGRFDARTLVEIALKDGRILRQEVRAARGSPDNPMTRADEIAKFQLCASRSAAPVSRARQHQIVEAVARLDKASDVVSLVSLIA
jgi:2-methylcitrate dehydratase PrpD